MKRRPILTALAMLALIALVPAASLAYTTGTAFPLITIDNSAGAQTEPHVSGDFAAYNIQTTAGANTIGFYTFSSGMRGTVPSATNFFDSLSEISGSNVVFTRVDISTGSSSIQKYSITLGTTTEVAPLTPPAIPARQNPAIGGSTICWEDAGVSATSDPEIVCTTGAGTTRITNDLPADKNPRVSPAGDMVVWEKCITAGQCAVYAAVNSGTGWTVSPIANDVTANETWPDTNGSIVVYASVPAPATSSSDRHVHFRTFSGGTVGPDQTIVMPAGWVREDHPSIAGNFISFEAFDGTQWDIWVYDISDQSLRRITNTAETEQLSDVSVSTSGGITTVRVVWQVFEADFNVYASEFTLSSSARAVPVDIKPGTCPNPLNVRAIGSLPVAILGTASFDVTTVDRASVRLEGVAPAPQAGVADVATPFSPFTGKTQATDCTAAGADGFADLVLHFDLQALAAALGPVQNGAVKVLHLTGQTVGGDSLTGEDVVVIKKK